MLNGLWKKILDHIETLGLHIIDFVNNPLVKLIRNFLAYLNSILNSLTALIPGIDAIKEYKEVIESYLTIADDL